ncbi:MAG: efflux transporter periplasmic adaptor subunit [Citrobacter freundii]|nr:MAG: efflux transporter periplasmic adaptor subunit [Citrobacter freundii]
MKRFKLLGVCLAIAAFAVTACSSNEASPEATAKDSTSAHNESSTTVDLTKEQYDITGIETGYAQMRSMSGVLKVNGYLDVPPQNLVSITTQMGGIIRSTPLLQGSIVKKGQVIAVLQNQDFVQLQQDYLDNKAQLEFLDAEYNRQQELAKENVNSQKTLQNARSQYNSMLAKVGGLKHKLELVNINTDRLTADKISSTTNIYSPVNGYVTKVNVNIGKFINPNDVMFEIVNGSDLHVELNVFEKDLSKIKVNQKVRFVLANETIERTATITLVGREINEDKTVRVHSITNGASGNFVPGTYLQALIEAGNSQELALPETAVVDFEGKKYVFVETVAAEPTQNAGTQNQAKPAASENSAKYEFKIVEVQTGISEAGFIAVQLPDQLQPAKTKIVLKGAYDLLSKMKNSEEEE